MNNYNRNGFGTTDTALAAYLIYLGFSVSIDTSAFPVSYRFEETHELSEAVTNWKAGTTSGNPRRFFDSYKDLLRRIKGDRE
jgi:hypothetical protein